MRGGPGGRVGKFAEQGGAAPAHRRAKLGFVVRQIRSD
jgi:hypothetical protein